MALSDTEDLIALMPSAVDLAWHRGPVTGQCDQDGAPLPKPVLHFALPLDAPEHARAFLQDHGAAVACYRLDLRSAGVLMIGLFSDALAKTIAREELNREVPEGIFGRFA
jgi:hypothetical protein